ncbi:hypothetical protein [Streptomyces sp. NPDC045470]|uniref:hypothetical protein n=1 Tax=Streptomyces sp. NPDC045470 TaxID=3155469 RepID=UPI003410A956
MEIEIARRANCLPVPVPRTPSDAASERAAAPLGVEDLHVVERILEAAVSLMSERADRQLTEEFLEALLQRLGAAQVAEGRKPATIPVLIEEVALLKGAVQQLRAVTSRTDLVPLAKEGRRVLRYLHVGLGRGRLARSQRGLPVWVDIVRSPR